MNISELAKKWKVSEITARGILADASPQVTDEQIVHIWEQYVGWPSEKYPLTQRDVIDFARALLDLSALSATEISIDVAADWPKDWRFVKKNTCYQIHNGNNCIANLVGPAAEENAKMIARILALSAPPAAETLLTDTFVQTVPDKCDRILWRGGYHHLPIAAASQEAKHLQGQWLPCTPHLIHAGIDCGKIPRRPSGVTHSRDHFIAHGDAPQEAKPVAAVNGVRWDLFPGWLIDHHEGDQIMEERLQSALADMLASDSYKAAIATAPQEQALADKDAIRELIAAHADLLEGNAYCYFELAYTRRTEWMAWLCDKPAEDDPSRKVLAKGQGSTAEEACADALRALQSQPQQVAE